MHRLPDLKLTNGQICYQQTWLLTHYRSGGSLPNVRTLGSGEGMLRPFEPLAAGRTWPALPEVHRLVADQLHRAVVVVSVRRIVVADAVDELDGGVASLPGGLVVANRRTVMSGPRATRRRPKRPRGLNRRGAPNLRAGVRGGGAPSPAQCTHIG